MSKSALLKRYWDEDWDKAMSFDEFVYYCEHNSIIVDENQLQLDLFDDEYNDLGELPKVEKIKKPRVWVKKEEEV
jgi:hypothetical protein